MGQYHQVAPFRRYIMIEELFKIYAKNCVSKYRIAQQCREFAEKIDVSLHSELKKSKDFLISVAYILEQI